MRPDLENLNKTITKTIVLLIALSLALVLFLAACGAAPAEEAPGETSDPAVSEDPAAEDPGNAAEAEPPAPKKIVIPREEKPATAVRIGRVLVPFDAEETDLSGIDLKTLPEGALEEALAKCTSLKKLTLIDCGLDNEGYAALQDAHPNIRMIWEIQMSHWTIRTDTIAFSSMKTCSQNFFMTNDEAYYFRYCTDMEALDLGHNWVSDLSFLRYMPKLKILILVDNVKYKEENGKLRHLTDVSEIQYCPELVYLELFANNISDFSFLEYTPKLRDLNISYNPIWNTTPIYGLKHLQRLWIEHTNISENGVSALRRSFPYTTIVSEGEGSIDQGWRGVAKYYALRDCFKNNYINPMFIVDK